MDAICDIKNFWTSLITENGISPHVESLMKIDDKEERGLALMSRVFFLWCMGIKYQREDLEHTFDLIRKMLSKSSDSNVCSKCIRIKALLEEKEFYKDVKEDQDMPVSLNDSSYIASKRKNLAVSPSQPIKKICTEDKENIDSTEDKENIDSSPEKENIDSSPVKVSSVEILVPETEPYLQIEDGLQKHFIIPETVSVDDRLYGNTDFYDFSEEPGENKLPFLDKCNTSPILGKVSKIHNSPALQEKKFKFSEPSKIKINKTISPTCARESSFNKMTITSPESVENSPSLLGCNILKQNPVTAISSTFKEKKVISTPLTQHINLEEKNIPTSLNELKIPSDLQSENPKDNSFYMKRNLRSTTSRNPLMKCKSEVGGFLSNKSRLSRLKTLTSIKDVNPSLEISSEQKKKKVYRQTKITQDSFFKQANVAKPTGGKCDVLNIDDDDDKAMDKAIEASLHTKEVEDLLRKKHQEIDKEIVRKKLEKSPLGNALRKSPRTKCQKSLQFSSPSTSTSKVSEKEILSVLEKDKTLKTEEGNNCAKLKKIKKSVFQDSFNVLPVNHESEPGYAYKGNVARKNSEKQRLDGWNCHECRDYYESKDLTEEQRKILQNKCSRHRSKYRPLTNTPEGFWNVEWSDEES